MQGEERRRTWYWRSCGGGGSVLASRTAASLSSVTGLAKLLSREKHLREAKRQTYASFERKNAQGEEAYLAQRRRRLAGGAEVEAVAAS
ncbi:hypothetical protein NC653_038641 [Populus alba x Populus x berolinensis]|uniref:Uncharacterized protein n=1 Tax=Populus alba x Populus x berolinensis TaxID=444605 RepID=A0AAD6LHI7_9ROSI|nr:hypothetical protein NC653_038641 [Populus alba x Populus x berolinensis]